jgi:hypothetical protein
MEADCLSCGSGSKDGASFSRQEVGGVRVKALDCGLEVKSLYLFAASHDPAPENGAPADERENVLAGCWSIPC